MQAIKTYARVQSNGTLSLDHLPFSIGEMVEVTVVSHRCENPLQRWQAANASLRSRGVSVTPEVLAAEIDTVRGNQ